MKRKVEATTTVLMYAFRYALGRQTGAPDTISDAIRRNVEEFKEWELKQIVEEIKGHEEYVCNLGMDCDKATWYSLIEFIEEHLKQ